MTATKLNDARRRDKIEYNFRTCPPKNEAKARFSDQKKSWWAMREGYREEPPRSILKEKKEAEMNAVTGKVTENEQPAATFHPSTTERAAGYNTPFAIPSAETELGPKTVARWSQGFVPLGVAAKTPRMFDMRQADNFDHAGVKVAPSLCSDEMPLDSFSSFKNIREKAGTRDPLIQASLSRSLASEKSLSSTLGHTMVNGKPPRFMPSDSASMPKAAELRADVTNLAGHSIPNRSSSMQASGTPREGAGSSTANRRGSRPKMNTTASKTLHGQDLPMTARLGRLWEKGISSPMSTTARLDQAHASTSTTLVPDRLSVRTGGFQWLDKTTKANDLSREASSTMEGGLTGLTSSLGGTRHRLGTETPGGGSRLRLDTETPRSTGFGTPR